MIALLFVLLVPRDTVLVSVELVETREMLTVEAIQDANTLYLPGQALRDLTGAQFAGAWVSLDELRAAYPTLTVTWSPSEMRVVVYDGLQSLPATRKFYETHRANAFGAVPIPQVSGPFGSWSVDDQKRSLAELGYTYRGRATVFGRVDDRGVGQWNVSVAPTPHLFVSGVGGSTQPTMVSGRVQAGPIWLLSTFTPHQPLDLSGLIRLGSLQMFAGRQFAVLTIQPTGQLVAQVARSWRTNRTVARLSFGPYPASPFSFPVASLSH